MKCVATLAVFFVALSFSSCGILPDNAPKLIDADGNPYMACEGVVWVEFSSVSGMTPNSQAIQADRKKLFAAFEPDLADQDTARKETPAERV